MVKPFRGKGDVVVWLKKEKLVARFQHVNDRVSLLPLYLEGGTLALYLEMDEDNQTDMNQTEVQLNKAFTDGVFTSYRKLNRVWWLGKQVDIYIYVSRIRWMAGLVGFEGDGLEKIIKLTFVTDTIFIRLQQVPNIETDY